MLRLETSAIGQISYTKINKEAAMIQKNILSERPEAQQEAVLWAKEVQARIERSDKATKEFKEKFTTLFLENIQKYKVSKFVHN